MNEEAKMFISVVKWSILRWSTQTDEASLKWPFKELQFVALHSSFTTWLHLKYLFNIEDLCMRGILCYS